MSPRLPAAFLQIEAATPDYLAGATPGGRVMVMIRRSTAVAGSEPNPGQAQFAGADAPQIVTDPDWATMPRPGDMNGYFPDRALRMSISGAATVKCTVGAQGDLLGCWVADETPTGAALAEATLHLSTFLRMKPAAKDGSPTAGRMYTLHATFDARQTRIALSTGT